MTAREPIRDLDAPPPRHGRRSNTILLVAVALAVAAGGGAAALRRAVGPDVAPSNVSIEAPADRPPVDPVALRTELLEQLIDDSRSESDPRRLPAFQSFALPCRRAVASCSEVVDRLMEPGVPWSLRRAFAAELPRGADALADRLLLGPFADGDDDAGWEALDVLRRRKRLLLGSDLACGCGFGLLESPEDAWLVAFAGDGATMLTWAPQERDGRWVLGVRSEPTGTRLLRLKLSPEQREGLSGGARIHATEAGPPAGSRKGPLPPAP